MRREKMLCAAVCLYSAAFSSVCAFNPMTLMPVSTPARGSVILRPRAMELRVSGLALSAGKTQIVTYGDLWRDAVIEEGGGEKGTDDDNYQTSVGTELSMMATEAMKPIKAAATGVASAVWSKLSPSPDDEEIQRNLKAFASQHSGAVMTPLGDDELANEVRYLGMFPDLVDALLEAEEDKVESEEEAAAAAAAVAAAAISAEASTDQDETVQQPPTIAPAPPPLAM